MQRAHRVAWLLRVGSIVAILLVIVAPNAGAVAEPPEIALIDDVGAGFVADAPVEAALGGQTRVYRHPQGQLTLQGQVLPRGMAPTVFINTFAGAVGGDFPEVEVPSIPGARAFQIVESSAGRTTSMIFASAEGVFIALLQTDSSASWDPIAFLESVAARQIERSGGVYAGPAMIEVPDEISRYLPPPDDVGGEYLLISEFGGSEDLRDDIGADPQVVDFLNRNTLSAVQVWSAIDSGALIGVSVTRYPFERFAAAALGAVLDGEDLRAAKTAADLTNGIAGAVAFEGTASRSGEMGVVFRRGKFTFSAIIDQSDSRSSAALDGFVQLLARAAPPGSSDAQPLPSSTASLVLSAVLVVGFGALLICIRWLLTRRIVRVAPVRIPAAVDVLDASDDARHLRRSAFALTAVQLATWAAAIVGFAADAPIAGRIAIVAVALLAGFVTTGWWRRRELARIGTPPPPWRPSVPEFREIGLTLVGIAMFLGGMAAVIWGLRELVFVPSLTHLQWCDRLGISPVRLAVLIAIGGAVVVLLASATLRLARTRGRGGAERIRRRDPRPPVLYLRSFDDDDVALPCVLSARRPFLELFTLRTTDPFEESLAWELATYGPVTAVGRPGGPDYGLGAAREHFTDDSWQSNVLDRMAASGVIAVVIGDTPGLSWEIQKIVEHGHLDKTIFLVPPGSIDDHTRRWDVAREGLPVDLRPHDVDLSSVVSFQSCARQPAMTVVDRRDEAAYRVAVDYTLRVILKYRAATGQHSEV